MYQTNYHRASSVADAVKLLKKSEDGKLLSGGMTLIPTMKSPRMKTISRVLRTSSGLQVTRSPAAAEEMNWLCWLMVTQGALPVAFRESRSLTGRQFGRSP